MERDTTKLWRLTKALNDEGNKGQKITLEEDGQTLTDKVAANAFAQAYATESSITIPPHLQKEFRKEEKERTTNGDVHESMQQDITIQELNAIKQLKKKKSPGPDNITNEMLQHLGSTALTKLLDIFNLSWREGQVSQCWKEARMIPVLKKGKNKSPHQPDKLRLQDHRAHHQPAPAVVPGI
ncbi:hypothetical protein C0Q70_21646 [Pomacea canaliculata]|uniref:Reverse transcriptase domain-containing protein n=1 Tax=Pomacea canaliculata TaxID=400727 RepID=A0A2T7ND42_POMCA|nr:hypothetical protein C0Q70_21646 [Pomacea canaliculata]